MHRGDRSHQQLRALGRLQHECKRRRCQLIRYCNRDEAGGGRNSEQWTRGVVRKQSAFVVCHCGLASKRKKYGAGPGIQARAGCLPRVAKSSQAWPFAFKSPAQCEREAQLGGVRSNIPGEGGSSAAI
eukprot:1670939-Rhodomonas_salina.5